VDVLQCGATALIVYSMGHRARAEDMRRMARERLEEPGASPLRKLEYLHAEAILEMSVGRMRNMLDAATEGLAIAEAHGLDAFVGGLATMRAGAASALGRFAEADAVLDRMAHVGTHGPLLLRCQYAWNRALTAFDRGELESAWQWITRERLVVDRLGFRHGMLMDRISLAVVAATRGDEEALAREAVGLTELTADFESPWLRVTGELALAYCGLVRGLDVEADVRRGFARLRELGTVAPFHMARRVAQTLVTFALERGIEPELAAALARGYELDPGPEALALAAWPWPVRLRVLGPLELEVDGARASFGRKAPAVPLALLELLASSPEPISAARVTSALWPGYGADAPRGSLDTAVYRLRKILGRDEAIEIARGRLALSPGLCWTDVRALRVACARIADLAARPGDLDALERAERLLLDVYRGPLGRDDAPPPALKARDALRRLVGRAVADLRTAYRETGELERAARLADAVRARDEAVVVD
jgi:hypothetical protein